MNNFCFNAQFSYAILGQLIPPFRSPLSECILRICCGGGIYFSSSNKVTVSHVKDKLFSLYSNALSREKYRKLLLTDGELSLH